MGVQIVRLLTSSGSLFLRQLLLAILRPLGVDLFLRNRHQSTGEFFKAAEFFWLIWLCFCLFHFVSFRAIYRCTISITFATTSVSLGAVIRPLERITNLSSPVNSFEGRMYDGLIGRFPDSKSFVSRRTASASA